MTAASLRAGWILLPAVLAFPLECSAIWVCHGPNGTTWQQEYPPCVTPVQEPVQRPQRVQAVPLPAPRQSPSQTNSTSTDYTAPNWERAPANAKASYDRLLAELEGRYPAINPDSPAFNQAVLDRVAEQMRRNTAVGMQQMDALKSAVETILPRPAVAAPAPPTYKPPPEDVPNTLARAVATVVALTGMVFAAKLLFSLVRWMLRSVLGVASSAVSVASNTSAHDLARAAGSVTAVAQQKSSGLVRAFKEGQRAKSADQPPP
jgi:hypothetical protein